MSGKKENKFGISEKIFKYSKLCKKSQHLNLKYLSVHIGSQILENKPYEKMLEVI